jgi:hypothetical protein
MSAECYASPVLKPVADYGAAEPRRSSAPVRELRRDVDLPAVALLDDGSIVSVKVLNLSYDGCRIEMALALSPGTQFLLSVLGLGKMRATVRWYKDGFAGLSFRQEPIDSSAETPRQHTRVSLKAEVRLRKGGQTTFLVQTSDLSPSGCKVDFVDRPAVGERHWVKFDGMEALEAQIRWVRDMSAGVEFVRPIYPAVFELLLARLDHRP